MANETVENMQPLKNLSFEYMGTTYTMEFNRRTAALAERQLGFSLVEFQSGKVSYLPDLFQCSLMMHHPNMKQATAQKLFDLMSDKEALAVALAELYMNAATSLLAEPEEGKAISWTRH